MAETGNKEFKGIKMYVIWQMVEAIVIPIITYACEGWKTTKEENNKLQSIFNDAIKTLLYLPKGTPTTILLNETGNVPIQYIIKKKKILQAKRISEMKEETLIKDATNHENSTWGAHIAEIAKELHVYEQMPNLSKDALKKQIEKEIETKILEEIATEAEKKTKVNHWKKWKKVTKVGQRPKYMDKLSRKQCNAVLRARASMLMVKENYKTGQENTNLCRFCKENKETQEHIIQECTKIKTMSGTISYEKIFEENTETLKTIAEEIIKLEEILWTPNLPCMSSSHQSEPPGWPGQMHHYYYYYY